jgi:6-phosphogluconolactonase
VHFPSNLRMACRFLAMFAVGVAWFVLPSVAQKPKPVGKYLMYVGTYTVRGSKGIYAYRYEVNSGLVTSLGLAAATENPSFLTIHPNGRFLYAVNELQKYKGESSGGISAFTLDPQTGKLTQLNELASRGADPCYISVDHTGKFVLVANYTGGNVAVFPVLENGGLGEASAFDQHKGSGPNKDRQEGPHAHWIDLTADNRFALSADLGLDEVLVYHFDADKGTLGLNDPPFVKGDPGAGPRHIAISPNGKFVYVVNEINSTVTQFSYDPKAGVLQRLESWPTLPKDFKGENTTAEIAVHPNGKFLYVSNRGDDSIVVFAIHPVKGTLTFVERVPTGGKEPRNFAIGPAGRRLFAANQNSDNIVVFNIDSRTGRLKPTGQQLKVPSPVDIKFVAVE